jgi:methionyl-tRNA formyltransferase
MEPEQTVFATLCLDAYSESMTSHPLTSTEVPLVRGWSEAVLAGHSLLPRQMVGGHELAEFFSRGNQADGLIAYLLGADDVNGEGAFVVARQCTTGHDAQLGWLVPSDVTRHALRRLVFAGLDLAFSTPGLQRVTWDMVQNDGLSMAWCRNFGFIPEGRFRQLFHDGRDYLDVLRFALLKADWLAVRGELAAQFAERACQGGDAMPYAIQILTDAGSWIAPWVEELAQAWECAGHMVRVAHKVEHALPADFCFCLSFSRIVSGAVRGRYKHTLVVHESDLPQGRGWAPMTWQILEGKTRIPVTLIEAADVVDAGPVYLQEWIDLSGTELNPEWRALQGQITIRLCRQWVRAYPGVVQDARAQVGEGSVYPRRRPGDSQLDPKKTLAEQFNLLRVVDNESYPAYFDMNGRRYRLGIDPQD